MSDEEKYYEAMREAADREERTEIEQGHQPHIVPTRRDEEIAGLEREMERLRVERDECRRLLREAMTVFSLGTDAEWSEWLNKANEAAGGSND